MSVREGYKETEVGVIPVDWEVKQLSDFSELTSSKRVHLSDYVDVGIPFYRGKEITLLKKNEPIDDLLYISEEQYNKIKNQFGIPMKNDILITAVGTLANTYRIPNDKPFYFKDGNLIWLKDISENSPYIDFTLGFHKKKILDSAIGSSQKALTIKELKKVKLPIPPLKEQEKIADILTTADDKIEAIALQIQKAETLKKGLLQKLLSEGIGHTEFKDSELGRIPVGWEINELSKLMKIKHGYAFKSNHFSTEETHNIVLTPGNVEIGGGFKRKWFRFYDDEPFPNEYILKNGDILISMTDLTPTAQTLGFPFIIPSSEDKVFLHNQRLGKIEFRSLEAFPLFIFSFLCSSKYRTNIVNGSTGTTVRHTSPSRILEQKLALPPLKEQKEIADILSLADKKIEILRVKKEKYKTLKQGLMQKLLSGEVRV